MDLFDSRPAPKIQKHRPPDRRGPGRPRKYVVPAPDDPTKYVLQDSFAAVIRAFMATDYWKSLAQNTQKAWARELLLASRPDTLGAVPIDEIRPKLVQAFLDGLEDRPGKQYLALTALKQLENWAAGPRELLPRPITTGCTILPMKGGHKPWSEKQVALAIAAARPDLARTVALAAATGQRPSDLVQMKWADLETDPNGRLGIGCITKKVGLELWLPFTLQFEREFKTWTRHDPLYILTKPRGGPWNERDLGKAWTYEKMHNPALESLRHLVLHGLRATAVVRFTHLGATTRQISETIGLSEPMVARYSRFASRKQTASATIIQLDEARTKWGVSA